MRDSVRRRCQSDGGGPGVRSVVLLPPSAHLTSATSTAERASITFPARLGDAVDSEIAPATSAWLKLAYYSRQSTPTASAPIAQRSWDDPCCKVHAEMLFDSAVDYIVRARLLALPVHSSPGSGG